MPGPLYKSGIRTKTKGLARFVPRYATDKWVVFDLCAAQRALIPPSAYGAYVASTTGRSGPFVTLATAGTTCAWVPHNAAYSSSPGAPGYGQLTIQAAAAAGGTVSTPSSTATGLANSIPMQNNYRTLFEAEIFPLATTIEGIQQIGCIGTTTIGAVTARGIFAHKVTAAHTWTVYMGDGSNSVSLGSYTGTAGTMFKIGGIWYGNNYAEAFVNNVSLGRVDVSSLTLSSTFAATATTAHVAPVLRTLDAGGAANSALFHRDLLFAGEVPWSAG